MRMILLTLTCRLGSPSGQNTNLYFRNTKPNGQIATGFTNNTPFVLTSLALCGLRNTAVFRDHWRGFKVVSLVLAEDACMPQICIRLPAWAQISLSGCCLAAGRSRMGKSTSGRVVSSAAHTHRPRWTACLEECLHLDQTRWQTHIQLAEQRLGVQSQSHILLSCTVYYSLCLSCSKKKKKTS